MPDDPIPIQRYRRKDPVGVTAIRYQPGPHGNCAQVAKFTGTEAFTATYLPVEDPACDVPSGAGGEGDE